MNKELSNCCQSLATVNGNTTKYYVCDNCGEPCDLLETSPQHYEGVIKGMLDLNKFNSCGCNLRIEKYLKDNNININ